MGRNELVKRHANKIKAFCLSFVALPVSPPLLRLMKPSNLLAGRNPENLVFFFYL